MKGVVMLGYEAAEYGTYQYNLGTPGAYEFLIIQSINNLTGNIIFTRNLLNSYDVAGFSTADKGTFLQFSQGYQ